MSRKARRETGLRQLRVNGYSIRERRNTAGLRQFNAKQAQARVKSPSKARPMRVAAQKTQHFVIGLGIVA
ncbi:hypothetical protein [Halothiobacillus neapolitanus]|uniref:Uncharacterized protein n=1 Tax=Halothiobacillus neapolitanus (strain ATCC 23641 / DSM 15147 / CIP 104769 / NCIMB 8539 / c2) TaxID=555778 RepID=D0KY71_HALNC|nr:hypothetical protein [Halothiobacillus neapolitanus]ACX95394.1 hypothetical protein Hneap_0540 [Halothiobacillus neapolitanus c2]TDN65692.1 hypothetical protein C8D83_1012 [Halothiobacillus neapolitanus]